MVSGDFTHQYNEFCSPTITMKFTFHMESGRFSAIHTWIHFQLLVYSSLYQFNAPLDMISVRSPNRVDGFSAFHILFFIITIIKSHRFSAICTISHDFQHVSHDFTFVPEFYYKNRKNDNDDKNRLNGINDFSAIRSISAPPTLNLPISGDFTWLHIPPDFYNPYSENLFYMVSVDFTHPHPFQCDSGDSVPIQLSSLEIFCSCWFQLIYPTSSICQRAQATSVNFGRNKVRSTVSSAPQCFRPGLLLV